ncbi:hypothetical protein [Maribellus mangrovi]|uniref:hypothetical protein n=1 Tax=Maribellus mangrovi TaxID=3133146 RepID=UPI0030EE5AC9
MIESYFEPIFLIIWLIAFASIVYCIWFAIRYDKDSNQIFLLVALNALYLPFYFSRMKKIKTEMAIKAESEGVLDSDFLQATKFGVLDILDVWASKERQINFQKSVPESNITKLLFEEWDNYFKIDSSILNEAFTEREIELLNSFDQAITRCFEKIKDEIPSLKEFQETNDFNVLNSVALKIKNEIE